MKIHLCTENPCPLADMEIVERFEAGFNSRIELYDETEKGEIKSEVWEHDYKKD